MHFLPDVYVPCEACRGKRYNRDTLEVWYKGKNIAEVLEMSVEEAVAFFANVPRIARRLKALDDVGLGYIKLGQPATTLSGGEAQRVKLASELSKVATGRTLYILDEPTTGLHFADIDKLLEMLQRLVDAGQHRGRHRAQPRRHQVGRLDRRPRARGRGRGRRHRRRGHARGPRRAGGDLPHRRLPGTRARGRDGRRAGLRHAPVHVPQPRDAAHLRAILPRIPNQPGVYRFMGAAGEVLYVGKAKELRKRVSSYFRRSGTPHGRTPEMLVQARDIEWVVTASESEALLLEDNFIKESRPPFNLRLRDDKSYPFIEITLRDEWPRVRFFRGRHVPGNLYFGPYSSARKVRDTLDVIGRIFPYRKCRGVKPGRPSGSPCLQYFIKRSLAPCDARVTHEEYMEVVQQAIDFLRGRLGAVEKGIAGEMAAAAAAQEFERAAMLRDRLAAVRHVHERQVARIEGGEAFDVIGLHQGEPGANVQVFRVRDGAVVDRQAFYVENAAGRDPAEVIEEFLLEFYWDGATIPPQVVAPLEESEGVAALLAARRGAGVTVRAAKRGPKRRLLELARHNAELAAQAEAERLARRSTARIEALESLRDGLGLEGLPLRIECYDISNLGEQHVVGSMVVFEGGVAKKAHYRKFALRDVQGQDDFAMMNQVLRRRFERQSAARRLRRELRHLARSGGGRRRQGPALGGAGGAARSGRRRRPRQPGQAA